MKISSMVSMIFILVLLTGCGAETREARGFSLPEGDPAEGEIVFMDMGCNSCHSLPNIEQAIVPSKDDISVKLGGKVTHIKTYGELVTSVINPSHRIAQIYKHQNTDDQGQSAMRNYNDVMTVAELVDLVSFLQSQYELKPYKPSEYPTYYYSPK